MTRSFDTLVLRRLIGCVVLRFFFVLHLPSMKPNRPVDEDEFFVFDWHQRHLSGHGTESTAGREPVVIVACARAIEI